MLHPRSFHQPNLLLLFSLLLLLLLHIRCDQLPFLWWSWFFMGRWFPPFGITHFFPQKHHFMPFPPLIHVVWPVQSIYHISGDLCVEFFFFFLSKIPTFPCWMYTERSMLYWLRPVYKPPSPHSRPERLHIWLIHSFPSHSHRCLYWTAHVTTSSSAVTSPIAQETDVIWCLVVLWKCCWGLDSTNRMPQRWRKAVAYLVHFSTQKYSLSTWNQPEFHKIRCVD